VIAAGRSSLANRALLRGRSVAVPSPGPQVAGSRENVAVSGRDQAETMPSTVQPMTAYVTDHIPRDDAERANEIKWDGYRMIGFVAGGRLRLQTRNLLDATADFPEVGGLGAALGDHRAVLDGEVVGLDGDGRPSFSALQRRGVSRPPVVYMIFDVLHLDGSSTRSLPYVERRRLLDELELGEGPAWRVPGYHVGDGTALLENTRVQRLEGLISKRLDSTYEMGRRSRAWLKIKNWGRQEFVIAGWMPGEGGRAGHAGSFLLGYYDDEGNLHYAGRVGTGFTFRELADLEAQLQPLARPSSPFGPDALLPPDVRRFGHFVEPVLVAEVMFSEWTHTNTVRQPSYKGLRTDKAAREVRLER
jgi:bifunctional non-homologous end joining protein LigD